MVKWRYNATYFLFGFIGPVLRRLQSNKADDHYWKYQLGVRVALPVDTSASCCCFLNKTNFFMESFIL